MAKLDSEQRARLEEAGNILAQASQAICEALGNVPVTGDAELVCFKMDVRKLMVATSHLSKQAIEIAEEGASA